MIRVMNLKNPVRLQKWIEQSIPNYQKQKTICLDSRENPDHGRSQDLMYFIITGPFFDIQQTSDICTISFSFFFNFSFVATYSCCHATKTSERRLSVHRKNYVAIYVPMACVILRYRRKQRQHLRCNRSSGKKNVHRGDMRRQTRPPLS